jgi:branched-subunit amino acid aminotransferase/4-amino-4-deoxychorismate lyase
MGDVWTIDGEAVDGGEAALGLRDRAIWHGDAVYEVLRAYRGRPFALEEHLGRLQRSARAVGRVFPSSVGRLAGEVHDALRRSGLEDAMVRVLLTRGSGGEGLGLHGVRGGRRIVMVRPLPTLEPSLYERGLRARLVEWEVHGLAADLARIKSANYLARVVALQRAQAEGFDEALLMDRSERVWEASAANVFVLHGRTLTTPALDGPILAGVTREKILELATDEGLIPREGSLTRADVMTADEVFVTSSVREVVPITAVDDHTVGEGRAGPRSGALRRRLRALAGAVVQP